MVKEKTIETRKDEVRQTTTLPKEMLGKFLAKRVIKGWTEDFVDDGTGEVVTIERNEVLFDRGMLLDKESISKIQFYLEAGDIQNVEVSNQRRLGYIIQNNHLFPWTAIIRSGKKKKRFLLYADSAEMVIEVIKDYVELNFQESFYICQIKDFGSCIILKDTLKKYQKDDLIALEQLGIDLGSEEEEVEGKFYQIDVSVITEDMSYQETFIIETKDVDKAMIVIRGYIEKQAKEAKNDVEIKEVKLEGAKGITVDEFIDREFSLAYAEYISKN